MAKYKPRTKLCTCSRCNKVKTHFGLGMCSACLRRTKRETKPEFYLGTCFSEMSRRVKTYDPLRPNYFGKDICKRDIFIDTFKNDLAFLNLYKNWQDNNFKRKYAPTIDRVNNDLDYTIDNLKFISHYNNSTKDIKIKTLLKDSYGKEYIFESNLAASKFLNIAPATFCKAKKLNGKYKGYIIYELT
jgi:hypothetical protein